MALAIGIVGAREKTHTYTKICAFAKIILLCTTTYLVQNSGQNRVASRQPTQIKENISYEK